MWFVHLRFHVSLTTQPAEIQNNMARPFPHNKIIIATHNAGKLREFASLLALPGLGFASAGDYGLPEPEETGSSFAENAHLKAAAASRATGLAALADDSGLAIDALDGAPGIYSARWAMGKNFAPAFAKIERLLHEKGHAPTGARAAFVAALALVLPDGTHVEAEGRVEGTLVFPPRGTNGFGYDPLFIPESETRTFGEMTGEEKARFSHRARAIKNLHEKLQALFQK